VDRIKSLELDLIINTPLGRTSRSDDKAIRRAAVQHGVTCITTLAAAEAAIRGIRACQEGEIQVASLQELHPRRAPLTTGTNLITDGKDR